MTGAQHTVCSMLRAACGMQHEACRLKHAPCSVPPTTPAGASGARALAPRLYNVPWAINRMLHYLDKRYGGPELWILENGISEKGEAKRTGADRTADPLRTKVRECWLLARPGQPFAGGCREGQACIRRQQDPAGRSCASTSSATRALPRPLLRPRQRPSLRTTPHVNHTRTPPPRPCTAPQFFRGYIDEVCKAVASGVKLTHYFAWSFTDNVRGPSRVRARMQSDSLVVCGTPAAACAARVFDRAR